MERGKSPTESKPSRVKSSLGAMAPSYQPGSTAWTLGSSGVPLVVGVPESWESTKTCLWGLAHLVEKADRVCSCTAGLCNRRMVSSLFSPLCYSTQAPWTLPPSVRTHPRRRSGEARSSGQLRASPPEPHCRIKGRVEGHTDSETRME